MNEYKSFNDVEFDIESYQEVSINKELIKSRVKSKLSKRKSKSKKILAASVSGLVLIGGLSVFREPVYANMYKVMYDIKNALGVESNLEDYKTVVGQSITKNGLTITLNEVILDKDVLIVSTAYKFKEELEDGYIMAFENIYINGKPISSGGGGSGGAIDKNTVEKVFRYTLDEDVKKHDLDIKIVYSDPIYLKNKKENTINGKWAFEFKTNRKELELDTKSLKLNQSFELGKDETITLKEYRTNALGPNIIYDRNIHNKDLVSYDIKLLGKDNLGNDVEFYLISADESKGKLTLYNLEENLDKNVTELKLIPYAAKQPNTSGKMSDDFKKIGDEFTINLNELK
ncbi:DUF4179 domain-containing protein [Paraclostridium bifermentans]|uniref:DUF4179 domain-containing protein n=1 Tax=Paraclostridium bifermentans TaxID=1490 RepID=UPI001FF2A7BB|nr:DUF4179 domain-containing protein [Paraclostridium bifermentans]UOW69424.1 DUF4179 domain-containing protein [Paraclostridium bifermentans]